MQEVIPVRRKNPYSLVDVNQVDIEQLTASRRGQAVIVGADVAKRGHVACLVWPDRSFERPWTRTKGDATRTKGARTKGDASLNTSFRQN